ncbi:sugar transferase, partial [Eggerthella lenta]
MKNAVVEPPVNKFYLTEESFSEGSQRESVSVSEEEFFRAAAKRRNGKLDAGRTVRSGYAYDFDSTDQVPFSDFERAAKVKAELGEGKVEGLGSRPAYRVIKRAFDVVFSGLVLVCFSWLYLLIALIVKVDDPKGPVFFKQTRVGMNGKEFQMLKFRSMCVDAKEKLASLQELNEKTGPVFKIADDPRITRVGKWLRKLSLAS